MGSERMVEIVKRHGPERVIVDSSADWGISDPLSVPKTAALMRASGIAGSSIEKTCWSNALAAYGQSGQIDLAAIERPLEVDQRRSFRDNSVLRGQEPRMPAGVPN
jgi:hypothetical protein